MHALLEELVDLVFPPSCCRCERWLTEREPRGAALCESCRADLPWIDADACVRCQESPPLRREPVCPGCRARRPLLASCTAAVRYERHVEQWITGFKYPAAGLRGLDPVPIAAVRFLARESARRAPGATPTLVVPVPLHPTRLRSRGFDPAALVAREMARERSAPLATTLLVRTRDTPSQTGLDRRGRRRNVRGAFVVARDIPVLRGPIWLVDDVVTTGATLHEAARALQRAGADSLAAVCVARTPATREPAQLS